MMSSATVCLLLAILPPLSDAVTVQLTVGEPGTIPCGITGTYSFPQWIKDASVTISNIGSSLIHPDYRDRFSVDQTNNRSLIISNVHSDDKGSYVCIHSGGTNSPQTTLITVKEPSETNNGENVQIANCVLFVLAIVVATVVIIMCVYILKEGGEKKNKNEIKVILIVAAVLFITVSVFFIVMQTTVEGFEKLTEKEHIANITLLVVESVVFVLGVIAIIFLIWKICTHLSKAEVEPM